MVFSSLIFLYYFLPITLVLYFLSPQKIKNLLLLLVSLIFYAWGEPVYVFLIIFSIFTDYFFGRMITKYRSSHPAKAKSFLLLSIVSNLLVLGFFKYVDLIIQGINLLLGTEIPYLHLPLPIGISFYTFQTMSYIIDIYRGEINAQKNFISFAMYVALFPQLVAGPIVRYQIIEKQIHNRKLTAGKFWEGAQIFLIGLGKKVLIANNIGLLWNEIENMAISDFSVATAWLGLISFSFQIYFDFSGYSDMAVGLGKMFGFDFPRNFNYPFISKNISEFWRRWHMTLGQWFRDYVYIPLGGNRKGKGRTYINLFIVWMLTGLWHGASWNFMIWGLYFGVLIILERAFLQHWLQKMHPIFQHLYFVFFLLVGWTFFLFEDVNKITSYLKIMFGLTSSPLVNNYFFYLVLSNGLLLLIALIGSLPITKGIQSLFKKQSVIEITVLAFCFVLLLLSTAYLVDDTFNPFLYFRF